MTALASGRRGKPPGLEKTGGRTKGTPNKSTLALREKLAALGCDPPQELLKLARDPKAEMGLQANIYYWLLRHTYPVPKAGGDALDEALSSELPITLEEAVKLARYVVERYDSDAQNSNAASSKANEIRPPEGEQVSSEVTDQRSSEESLSQETGLGDASSDEEGKDA